MSMEQIWALQTILDAGGQIQIIDGRVGAYTKYTTGTYAEAETTDLADLANVLLAKEDILSYSSAI